MLINVKSTKIQVSKKSAHFQFNKMVILHVKRENESQFLYETDVSKSVDEVVKDLVAIFNGRLKVTRICYEIEELAKHGTFQPPEMQGLNEDQVRSVGTGVENCEVNRKFTGHHALSVDSVNR